jgi:hypothetical protein
MQMRGGKLLFLYIDSAPVAEGRQGKMHIAVWLLLLNKIVIISAST